MALILAMCMRRMRELPYPRTEPRGREESPESLPRAVSWSMIEHSANKLFTAAACMLSMDFLQVRGLELESHATFCVAAGTEPLSRLLSLKFPLLLI